jgi:hypothetical protein
VQNVVNRLVKRGEVVVKVWLKPPQIGVAKYAGFLRISIFLENLMQIE